MTFFVKIGARNRANVSYVFENSVEATLWRSGASISKDCPAEFAGNSLLLVEVELYGTDKVLI
jgi:hypothetical protein